MLVRSEPSETVTGSVERLQRAANALDDQERVAAEIRLAIADEMMRRFPEEFEPQRSAKLLGGMILLAGFAAITALLGWCF